MNSNAAAVSERFMGLDVLVKSTFSEIYRVQDKQNMSSNQVIKVNKTIKMHINVEPPVLNGRSFPSHRAKDIGRLLARDHAPAPAKSAATRRCS